MAESSEEELRRRRRRRLTRGLFLGGAAVGVPAALNTLVAQQVKNLPEPTWGSGDRFTHDHGEVAYQRLGEGPALVLLHAFGPGHSSAEWRQAAEELAPSFEVFAPDLPGWGLSSDAAGSSPDASLYIQLIRDFLKKVVDEKGTGRRAVLVAAGLSASYAVQVAVDEPDRVAALALVTPVGMEAFGEGPDMKDRVIHSFLRLPVLGTSALNIFTSRAGIAGYLRRDAFASSSLVDDTLIDLHYVNSHRPGAQKTLAAYLSGYLSHGIREVLPKVEVPTWIAWGRRAVSPSVAVADLWLSRLASSELEVFEQAGLLPHAESPGELSRKLESFLADNDLDVEPDVDLDVEPDPSGPDD